MRNAIKRALPNGEIIPARAIFLEVLIFAFISPSFATSANFGILLPAALMMKIVAIMSRPIRPRWTQCWLPSRGASRPCRAACNW